MQTQLLLRELDAQTRQLLSRAAQLEQADLNALRWRARPGSWSALECLEHLNRYGDFYLPQLRKAIGRATAPSMAEFRPGWLGGWFAQSMLPKEQLNRMTTFADKNPLHATLDRSVIGRFAGQQREFLELLAEAAKVNLNTVRVATSISPLLRLKLGDTFRFIMNHNLRHVRQLDRALAGQAAL